MNNKTIKLFFYITIGVVSLLTTKRLEYLQSTRTNTLGDYNFANPREIIENIEVIYPGSNLISPLSVVTDSYGNIYVSDSGNHRIQKYDIGTTTWTVFGSEGTEAGQFSNPYGVCVDSQRNIYVADDRNHRIQKYDIGTTTWTVFGSGGTGVGQFENPHGISVDIQDNIYVADTDNHRIQKYDIGTTTWTVFGSGGTGVGQFKFPSGVSVDIQGNIYVTDGYNHRIQKYDIGTTTWTVFGSEGAEAGQFNYPDGISVDTLGNIYVADTFNNRIQKFLYYNTISYEALDNGSVNGMTSQNVSIGGSSSPIIAVGNSGYSFLEWSDGSVQNPRIDVGVTGDISVSASFTNTRTVTNPNTNVLRTEINRGYISSDGDNPSNGQNYTFNINYTFSTGDATVVFPANTTATKTGGGAFNLTTLTTIDNSVEVKNEVNNSLAAIKINIPNINLTFSQPITIIIPVSTSYNGQTLNIYFRNEGSNTWVKETTCLIINGSCTFQTTHATTFTVVENPTQSSSNNSSPDSGLPDYNCHSSKPLFISDLFQIDASSNKAKIYFTPQRDTNDYVVSFSSKNKNAEEHGERVTLFREGVQSHTIYSLKPNTTYYLKVRGQNGCMPGDWSTIMKFKTGSSGSKKITKFYKYTKLSKLIKKVVR